MYAHVLLYRHSDSDNIIDGIDSKNSDEILSEEAFTQEKFDEMMEIYLTTRANIKSPSSWAKKEFEKAIKIGLTDGSSPLGFATRQEVALMVLRGSS